MKKFSILILAVMIFLACDYASEALDLKPDIEITYMDPVAYSTYPGDPTTAVLISEIHFVPMNSLDSYLTEFTLTYYDNAGVLFYGPTAPVAIYGKIPGIVQAGVVDTFVLVDIPVPLGPVQSHLTSNQSAKVVLSFVAVDEYFENSDTTEAWFGVYMQ